LFFSKKIAAFMVNNELIKSTTFRPIYDDDSQGTNLHCQCGARNTFLSATCVNVNTQEGRIKSRHWCCRRCLLLLTEEYYSPPISLDEQLEEPRGYTPLPAGMKHAEKPKANAKGIRQAKREAARQALRDRHKKDPE
jgi:hypothetical protein